MREREKKHVCSYYAIIKLSIKGSAILSTQIALLSVKKNFFIIPYLPVFTCLFCLNCIKRKHLMHLIWKSWPYLDFMEHFNFIMALEKIQDVIRLASTISLDPLKFTFFFNLFLRFIKRDGKEKKLKQDH